MTTNMRNVLAIPGYTNQSIWGYDEPMQTYFATIWADTTSGDDDPDIWISGITPIETEEDLAANIGQKLGLLTEDVLRYMHLWDTAQEDDTTARLSWWQRLLGRNQGSRGPTEV
ncbi:hypothetical protein ABH924_003327 [Arthrobacter sp. GAS37]|uniref:hypothetical protein n=1 Tax=Arthrobacter sp. GAS37 TaxID=3156261 RepID=UPI003832FDF8